MEEGAIPRTYLHAGSDERAAVITRFGERVEGYQTAVIQTTEGNWRQRWRRSARSVGCVGWSCPMTCLALGCQQALDAVDGVLTSCRLGIA